MMREIILGRALGQLHHLPDERLHPFRVAKGGHRFGRAGASHQIIDRALFAEPQAETLDIVEQAAPAGRLGIGEKRCKRRPGELLFGPALDRLEARSDVGFRREGREQRLGKAMDGLDSQAARRLEHLGEQAPRPLASKRVVALAEASEVGRELAILHPHPGSKPLADAVRHLGGAGLGEGQAEDGFGRDALQQQPEHARGQDLGLAAARRRRQRSMPARVDRGGLVALELGERLQAAAHQALASQAARQAS